MSVLTELLTAEQFVTRYPHHRVELALGVVKELATPGFRHGKVCVKISYLLSRYLEEHDIGHVAGNDTFVLVARDPDSVFGADVMFISYQRQPKGEYPIGLTRQVPELVVEVKSPSDDWTEMVAESEEYLAAGVVVVILVDPEKQGVIVARKDGQPVTLGDKDELTVPDVLPGFSVEVWRLFA